jgi:hypothetical protein
MSLLILLLCGMATSKTLEVPVDKIRSVGDLVDVLGDPPQAPDAPAGFSWKSYGGSLNISTNVLFPLEGQEVPPVFEVMPEIRATPLGAFQERYKDMGFYCVEIDFEAPACWPVVGEQPLPRFASVAPGQHTLRLAVTDPTGARVLATSWSPVRRFVVVDSNLSAEVTSTESGSGGEEKEDGAEGGDDGGVNIPVPIMRVVSPPEMSVLTTHFLDMTYEVSAQSRFCFSSIVTGKLTSCSLSSCAARFWHKTQKRLKPCSRRHLFVLLLMKEILHVGLSLISKDFQDG